MVEDEKHASGGRGENESRRCHCTKRRAAPASAPMSGLVYEGEPWQRKVTQIVGSDMHNGIRLSSVMRGLTHLRPGPQVQALRHPIVRHGTTAFTLSLLTP